MMQMINNGVCAPKGFRASGVYCGIRKNRSKSDLALIVSDTVCSAAAVFTQNKIKGAPIFVMQKHLENGTAQVMICNSGNANTCNTGGVELAEQTCELVAKQLGIVTTDVMVASTGVIGVPMTIEPFEKGVPEAVQSLSYDGSDLAALAIMTTDTVKKELAIEFEIGGKMCHIGSIAKGSGMINPNMATMLCFITTDVAISASMLQKALSADVQDTFNQISVDGDTSTNDTVFIMANGLAGNHTITKEGKDFDIFQTALHIINAAQAKLIAKDGEGATKIIECMLKGAPDVQTARTISKSVINSSLVKTAMFGEDANWGRVLCAMGYADAEFDISNSDVFLKSSAGEIQVCQNAQGVNFSEEKAKEILSQKEIIISIDLKCGTASAMAWGCDLTYDYVKINGDYRT